MVVDRNEDGERVSLAPLDPETALRALLAVKPDEDDEDDEKPDNKGAMPDRLNRAKPD